MTYGTVDNINTFDANRFFLTCKCKTKIILFQLKHLPADIIQNQSGSTQYNVTPISLKQKNGHSCFCTKMTLLCCDYKFRIPISLLKLSKCKLLSILSFHFWYLLKNISNDGGNFLCIFYSIFQKVYPDSWWIIYRKYVQLSPPP